MLTHRQPPEADARKEHDYTPAWNRTATAVLQANLQDCRWALSRLRLATARGRWLPACDALAAGATIALARGNGAAWGWGGSPVVGAIAAPVLLATLSQYEGRASTPEPLLSTACGLMLAAPFILLIGLALPGNSEVADARRIVLAVGLLTLAWLAARLVVTTASVRCGARVLVIGSGAEAQWVALSSRHRENRMDLIGLLDDDSPPQPSGAPPLLGGLADLEQVLGDHSIDRVIVTFARCSDENLVDLVRRCDHRDVAVDVVPRLFDVIKPGGNLFGGLPLAPATRSRGDPATLTLKRAFDLVAALAALIVCAPVMLVIALAVRLTARGQIFFWQERIGKDGQPFQVPKFRTMAVARADPSIETDSLGIAELVERTKSERKNLTPIGAWLRSCSLDELPQLWCVVRGEMSFVGPRPLRAFEVASLDAWQLERLSVRPGITGLWQVLGRSDTPWQERMRLDYLYTRHWSLALDIRIMMRTVPAVLRRRGAR